ncbi:MAG: hypothetical protein M5U34_01895 [Chloroflexi bacterium]|nr:hypothetical protein [Chloroflexota bacterium]
MAHITAPTLVIAGSEDKLTPPAYGRFSRRPYSPGPIQAAGGRRSYDDGGETGGNSRGDKGFLADL